MNTSSFKHLPKLLSAIAMVAAGSAFADSWDVVTGSSCAVNAGATVCTAGNVAVSGWSTGTGTPSAPTAGLSPTAANAFISAKVYNWGGAGLGVVAQNENSGDTGPHAADNLYGTDALLLNFSATGPVNLTSVKVGWNGNDNGGTSAYNDSDLSVFVWMGGGAPSTGTPTYTVSTLGGTLTNSNSVTSGWRLVGNYADVGAGTNETANIGGQDAGIYSSYWLISAYSTNYGSTNSNATAAGAAIGTLGSGGDAFKLLSVGGTKQTPEPGSLALIGVAMAGVVAARRRNKGAANS